MPLPIFDNIEADRQWLKSLTRAVTTQALGNLAVQGITFLGLPFISRVYDPEAFGGYGMVIAISSIGGMAFFCGMDIGLLATHKLHQATIYTMLLLASILAAFVSFAICLMFMGFSVALAITAFLAVLTQNWALISVQWAVLTEQHKKLSIIRIVQAVGFLVFGLIFARLWGASALTLILAAAMAPVPVILIFIDRRQFVRPRLCRIIIAIRRRWDFFWPAWPGRFVNLFASRAPMMVAPALFGSEGAGLLAMAFRLLEVPARTVSSAISNVFLTRAAQRDGAVFPVVLGLLGPLIAITVIVFGGLWLLIPTLIPFLLGSEWSQVIPIARILIVAVAVPFAISPLSGLLVLNQHGRVAFLWQIGFAVVVCILLVATWRADVSLTAFCGLFSALCLVCYLVYGWLILWSCSVRDALRRV